MTKYEVGQKVKVSERYWEICNDLYRNGYGPNIGIRKAMAELKGKTFTVREIFETMDDGHIYLLENDRKVTDGFAWSKEFLEKKGGYR